MVDFCKVRIFSRNRQHFTVFYRVASKISPKHLNRFLFRGIRGVSVRKESSDAARRRPYLFTACRLIMARRWRQCDRFLSYEQWVVSDEIWHKNRRNRFLVLSDERWVVRVGTSACSVRGFYSRKSRQSRQRHRVIFCEIRGIRVRL